MTAKTFIAAAVGIAILIPSAGGASPFNHRGPFQHQNSDAFGLQVAEDINPAANIVEINLEAKVSYVELTPGISSEVYTYNGTIPGPLIKAKVGDTLIVHFTNNLPEPTTIHWHGLRLPADMDGAAVAQNPIQPGESFRYEYVLQDASLFWYHPHVRSNEQVEKGLTGSMLVEPRIQHGRGHSAAKRLARLPQKVLVLDDVLLDDEGQIKEAFTGSIEEILLEKINGREGNTLLVNGKQVPTMEVRSGVPIRWRLVNIANTRFMTVEIPGHELTRIGGDGGLLETPITDLENINLVPGERADIVFTPIGEAGTELTIYWKDVERGRHSVQIMGDMVMMGDDELDGSYPDLPLLKLSFKRGPRHPIPLRLPNQLRSIEALDTTGAAETTLKFGHSMPMADGSIDFLINGKRYDQLTTDDTPDAAIGETQVWNLVNMTGGDHPFHLHGFFFQVLETITKDPDGNIIDVTAAPPLEDKDMVNLPHRPGAPGSTTTVKVAVRFDPAAGLSAEDITAFGGPDSRVNADLDNLQRGHSGGWQFHCHILEHADTGMMSYVEVGQ
jgi:FtsP/CotA-like multicopper oxidase with cupredoxin domain